MSAIVNKLWRWRYGGSTGLNQASNSVRMTVTIAGPFIALWFVIQLFAPEPMVDTFTLLGFFGWLGYVFVMYAKAKSDASSYFPFPQMHWFFQDGQQITYDVLVPPNGYEEIAEYPDKSKLYRVWFNEKLEYQDTDRPYPDVFERALWRLPAEWTESFLRRGHGEFFFKNIFVDHPACESATAHVIGWKEKGGTREPICVIRGSSYEYELLKDYMKEKSKVGCAYCATEIDAITPRCSHCGAPNVLQKVVESDVVYALYKDAELKINELTERNAYLEREAHQYYKEGPENVKKLSDKRMSRARKKVGHIMDTSPPFWSRIINLKTLGIAIIIVGLALLASHYWLGYP